MGLRQPQQQQALPEFELARKRLAQRSQAQQQQSSEALTRRFASIGASGSGVAIKTQQQLGVQLRREREQGEEQIQAAEIGERRRIQELEAQKTFATF